MKLEAENHTYLDNIFVLYQAILKMGLVVSVIGFQANIITPCTKNLDTFYLIFCINLPSVLF